MQMLPIRFPAALTAVIGRIWLDYFNLISTKSRYLHHAVDWVLKFRSDKASTFLFIVCPLFDTDLVIAE